ncbi:MAG: hypothetical protein ABFC34_05310 [Methanobacterium sp.]
MPESNTNPTLTGIPVLNPDGTHTGIRLYLDNVTKNGIATIIVRWNFRDELRTNEFDNTQFIICVYNEAWIKNWVLPGFYFQNGMLIQLGTMDDNENRVITTEHAEDYIRENALEIAGFGLTSKITYVC